MKKPVRLSALLVHGFILSSMISPVVFAKDDDETTSGSQDSNQKITALVKSLQDQEARLAEQEKKLAEQQKSLEVQQRALVQEKVQFEKLQTQVISLTGKPIPAASSTVSAIKQKSTAVKTSEAAAGTPEEVGTDRKASKEKPPEIPAIIDAGGVLTAAGKIVITPEVEYARSSTTDVEISGFSIVPALNIGLFNVSHVNRDMISPSLDVRYGVTNRFEIEGKVPYVYRNDTTLGRPLATPAAADTLTGVTGSDIGDVEFAAHYQINKGEGGWPYLVGNLRFKTATGTSPFEVPVVNGLETELPTGSGFYAIQPSLTAIFPSDPVVYYSNIGYLHNFSRSFSGFGTIDPGDGFSGSLGMSLSLNDKSSFSIGYSHTMVLKTIQNNAPIANSNVLQVGTVDLGYSYNLTNDTNLNFTVSAGVTSDAPDVRLILRVPMTFDPGW